MIAPGKRITYDHDPTAGAPPTVGDVLQTRRGRTWLVLASRQVKSMVSNSRWALRVQKLAEAPRGARVLGLQWYSRGPKR